MFWRRNRLFWDRNELLFKNERYAAITGVNQDEEVVTKTSRMLENGMRVKRKAS